MEALRTKIRDAHRESEASVLQRLTSEAAFDADFRQRSVARALQFIETIRQRDKLGFKEAFLEEYGLATNEGVALMRLAEALLRTPDTQTIDALIEDKLTGKNWRRHLGTAGSKRVNFTTSCLWLASYVLDRENKNPLRQVLSFFGRPIIRANVRAAMTKLGKQFVLGQSIEQALTNSRSEHSKGFTFSYDMLGEAAMTADDAQRRFNEYELAIAALAGTVSGNDIQENPSVSIKLSALHPRYDALQRERVLRELAPRVLALATAAKAAGVGLTIDAEEADRLDISLDVFEAVFGDLELAGWNGLGLAVQAYGKRASPVIDWLHALAKAHDKPIMVRLVKGAYWDTEIKRAQVDGAADFAVFTSKTATDISYLCCARKLLTLSERLYPQFATHNAHTVASILEMATPEQSFEFQRLHGMGEDLHHLAYKLEQRPCRIYAPAGPHVDLLAYLVRRLLENGANSSFVNQLADRSMPGAQIAADPFDALPALLQKTSTIVRRPPDLFAPERRNSKGWDLRNAYDLQKIDKARARFVTHEWSAAPLLAVPHIGAAERITTNPARPGEIVGRVTDATLQDVQNAIGAARNWSGISAKDRAGILIKASDLFEENYGEIFAALCREAGKTLPDCISELREAVDYLRYYANEAARDETAAPRGLFACISPWNFPLAIFTGQIGAALAAGNGVLAKPAESTPVVAHIAVRLLHEAGVPRTALQLLPGSGGVLGGALTSDPRIKGVCFTGSLETAQRINRTMAANLDPGAPLIAETGGVNAMIVDSTALAEQAVKDIVSSAFQSAGQRCSALRMLYVQQDIAPQAFEMLQGALDELSLGDPWRIDSDVGPLISNAARVEIAAHIQEAAAGGRLLKQVAAPADGNFLAPCVIQVNSIGDIQREVFGPVLHVATFAAGELRHVAAEINAMGHGLTFGLHTRIDGRAAAAASNIKAGNIYINRNQIGAVVGSQPFGGERLSGTGPKAGGPHYVPRFRANQRPSDPAASGLALPLQTIQAEIDSLHVIPATKALNAVDLPGPTGEFNQLSTYPRGVVLCLGPSLNAAMKQAALAQQSGCAALAIAPGCTSMHCLSGFLDRADLARLRHVSAVALWSDEADQRLAREALAQRLGPIIPLLTEEDIAERCIIERSVCIDLTAAGGNSALLASASDAALLSPALNATTS